MRRVGISKSRLPSGMMKQIMQTIVKPFASLAIHIRPHTEEVSNAWEILGNETQLSIISWYTSFLKREVRTILKWPNLERLAVKLLKGL